MINVELTTVVYAVEAYNEEISQEFAISDEYSSVAELRELRLILKDIITNY